MRRKKMIRQAIAEMDQRQREEDARNEMEWNLECQRILDSGVLEEEVLALALKNLTKPLALAELESSESVKHECNALYEVMPDEFRPAFLLVTTSRLIWSVSPKPKTIVSMHFDDVVQVGGADYDSGTGPSKGIRLTYRPADFPAPMRRFNPSGELDATFVFPHTLDLIRMSILARTGHPGPHDDDDKAQVLERLRPLSKDVTTWSLCPICCHDVQQMTESTMQCHSRRHLFSAPGVEPVIDESDDNFGDIVDQTRWMPIIEGELDFVDSPLIWLVWRDRPFGPPKILDYEVMRDAWDLGQNKD